jgi:alanine racemase
MKSYTLGEIARITGGRAIEGDTEVHALCWDSRNYVSHPGTLFIAIRGQRHDGHLYLPELIKNGLSAALVEQEVEGVPQVVVEDSLRALQSWAAYHRSQSEQPVIAVTGSYGKTEVKDRLTELLETRMSIARSPRSFNSQLGVPISVLGMESHHDMGIFEAGISRPDEMQPLAGILRPDIGLFTALGEAHDEGFEDRVHKLKEKSKLFEHCQVLVYPFDDERVREHMLQSFPEALHCHWGYEEGAFLHVLEQGQTEGGAEMVYCTGGGTHRLEWKPGPRAYLENEQHAMAALVAMGHTAEDIQSMFHHGRGGKMDTELVRTDAGQSLLIDNDLIDAPSLRSALLQLDRQRTGEHHLVILHQQEGSLSNEQRLKELHLVKKESTGRQWISVGRATREMAEHMGILHFRDLEEAESTLRKEAEVADQILLKGPWSPEFPLVRSVLEGVDHPTEVRVDMEALVENLNRYRRALLPGTRMMAMVKAFAYGSGDSEVAHLLAHQGVDYLAVAYPNEGVALRKKGVRIPIMVLHADASSVPDLLRYRLEPQVFSLDQMSAMSLAIGSEMRLPVHVEFDTGMHRLGFSPDEALEVMDHLQSLPTLELASVFSHLLASDDPQADEWNREQFRLFREIHERVLAHPICKEDTPWFHILNSGGISRFPAQQYDMVRLGIGLYGYTGDRAVNPELRPVLSWWTRISQIKTVKAGDTVGYGGTFTLDHDARIAILPVGYADGLDRRLGRGNGQVFIGGQAYPFIGNICMDMSMVDIGEAGFGAGEVVEIIGPHQTIEHLADDMGTIPYEVMAHIPARVRRRFVNTRSV